MVSEQLEDHLSTEDGPNMKQSPTTLAQTNVLTPQDQAYSQTNRQSTNRYQQDLKEYSMINLQHLQKQNTTSLQNFSSLKPFNPDPKSMKPFLTNDSQEIKSSNSMRQIMTNRFEVNSNKNQLISAGDQDPQPQFFQHQYSPDRHSPYKVDEKNKVNWQSTINLNQDILQVNDYTYPQQIEVRHSYKAPDYENPICMPRE